MSDYSFEREPDQGEIGSEFDIPTHIYHYHGPDEPITGDPFSDEGYTSGASAWEERDGSYIGADPSVVGVGETGEEDIAKAGGNAHAIRKLNKSDDKLQDQELPPHNSPPSTDNSTDEQTEVPVEPEQDILRKPEDDTTTVLDTANDSQDIPQRLSPVKRMIGQVAAEATISERHAEWPKLRLHFHFGSHTRVDDFAVVPSLVDNADVYCYEATDGPLVNSSLTSIANLNVGRSPAEVESSMDRLSFEDGESIRTDFYTEALARAVIGSGVIIGHFDVDPNKGDPRIGDEIDKVLLEQFALKDTLNETRDNIVKRTAELVDLIRRRDQLMLGPTVSNGEHHVTAGRFEKEMERIFTEYPELLQKDEVVVVDTHGSMHTGLYYRAQAAGVTVERSYADKPYTWGYPYQLDRTIAIGKEPTRELVTRAFVSGVLDREIRLRADPDVNLNSRPYTEYVRKLTDAFTETDTEALFEILSRDESPISFINNILAGKGVGPISWRIEGIYGFIGRQARSLADRKREVFEDMKQRRAASQTE